MTPFDDRFADRVREAFDAYEEPVDERALARLQAALASAPALAPDRPAAPRAAATPPRWRGLAVLATLLIAATGTWFALADRTTPTDGPEVAQTTAAPDVFVSPETLDVPEPVPPRIAQTVPPRGPVAPSAVAVPRTPRPEAAVVAVQPVRATVPEAAPPPDPEAVPDEPVASLASARVVEPIAGLPPAPVPFLARPPARGVSGAPIRLGVVAPTPETEGVRLVIASGAVGSGVDPVEGASVAAGVSREWSLNRTVSVSGGALLAYGRTLPEADDVSASSVLADLEDAPGRTTDVADRRVVTTVAVEVPIDVTLDVARTSRGRLRASVGLTSALYLDQDFEDEGTRYASERVTTEREGVSAVVLTSEPFASEESVGVLGRLDLGRQLNLGLGVGGNGPRALGLDLYVRLPLGGVTSRDLPLTVTGVRLRVPLP